mmetsp:Transcript_8469/g.21642  ORF Transcript_8469/g.21642 Transcript_8469/m.21642 type:complete len:211 (+) Transcript_8469:612-1244(+)
MWKLPLHTVRGVGSACCENPRSPCLPWAHSQKKWCWLCTGSVQRRFARPGERASQGSFWGRWANVLNELPRQRAVCAAQSAPGCSPASPSSRYTQRTIRRSSGCSRYSVWARPTIGRRTALRCVSSWCATSQIRQFRQPPLRQLPPTQQARRVRLTRCPGHWRGRCLGRRRRRRATGFGSCWVDRCWQCSRIRSGRTPTPKWNTTRHTPA